MKHEILQETDKYTKARQRRKRWYRIFAGLACVVVFCTVYALILPAITLEKKECQLKEHTHTDACYEEVRTLACGNALNLLRLRMLNLA